MQTRAIIEAACNMDKKGIKVPARDHGAAGGTKAEVDFCDKIIRATANRHPQGAQVQGEVHGRHDDRDPRAALTADQIAETAELLQLRHERLTQMTFGSAATTSACSCPRTSTRKILPADPFQTIDVAAWASSWRWP